MQLDDKWIDEPEHHRKRKVSFTSVPVPVRIVAAQIHDDIDIDGILGICATYNTPYLGSEFQDTYIESFLHSVTYRETKAALQKLIDAEVLKARADELYQANDSYVRRGDYSFTGHMAKRLQELEIIT